MSKKGYARKRRTSIQININKESFGNRCDLAARSWRSVTPKPSWNTKDLIPNPKGGGMEDAIVPCTELVSRTIVQPSSGRI